MAKTSKRYDQSLAKILQKFGQNISDIVSYKPMLTWVNSS